MKAKIEALKERYCRVENDEERELIREEIRKLCDIDADAVAGAFLECIRETNAQLSALKNNS